MIARGDTDGIFQLESEGMRKTLAGLRASSFIDIVHANALYRPGPMEMIPSFIRRTFGEEPVDYLHPALKEILAPTYGTIVFQEQIMMIARVFAGYTLGMADILRRAVSKKDARVLEAERERFVKSSTSRGYSAELGNKIYDYIVRFANYGFNKSHAVAYSLIAYQMAYLKRRYYRYFMAVLMSHSVGSVTAIQTMSATAGRRRSRFTRPRSIKARTGSSSATAGSITRFWAFKTSAASPSATSSRNGKRTVHIDPFMISSLAPRKSLTAGWWNT